MAAAREFGFRARALKTFRLCLRAVEITDLRRAKSTAPGRVRKPPEIFAFTFIILKSCSARLLVKGTSKSKRNLRVLLEGLEAQEEIVGGPLFLALLGAGRGVEGGQASVERQAFPHGGPISLFE